MIGARTRRIDVPLLARKHYSSLQRPYTFYTAADWAGKPATNDTPKPKASLPPNSPIALWRDRSVQRPSSGHASAGEDFFLCSNGVSMGVADGVGGWIEQGISSSIFAQAMMYHAHRHLKNGWAGEPEIDRTLETAATAEGVEMTPTKALQLAYRDVIADKTVEAGSSTACLLTLNASSGILRSANLGDSGFCIIRASSILYNSSPQTHFFNCPRQLAKLPPTRGRRFRDSSFNDSPTLCDQYSTHLRDGDITDGLSDNIFPSEILHISTIVMKSSGSEADKARAIAQSLVQNSRFCMFNDRVSPFELEARQHRKVFFGGVSHSYSLLPRKKVDIMRQKVDESA
ncbi:protein serine/threonine phosphatase 2C [Mycena vitilis]|nr:protein serine/threonine phosphatase 2C [Mycena vitilis]